MTSEAKANIPWSVIPAEGNESVLIGLASGAVRRATSTLIKSSPKSYFLIY